ncbi:MAG: hypothetical protein MAG453_01108 [Calditrichaeota bacterium]|nr:hypothetical protein [Calditrichota bacterium]
MRSGFGSGHWDETYRGEIYNNLIGADPYLPYHPFTGQDQPLGGDTDFNWGANDVNEDSYQDPLRAQFVIDHLIGGVPEPFFVMLGTRCTHYPAMPPREYLERFNPETVTLPPYFDADLDDIPEAGIELIQMNLLDSTKAHKHYHEIDPNEWTNVADDPAYAEIKQALASWLPDE